LVDATGQELPLRLRNLKKASEVDQRALFYLAVNPLRFYQSKGFIGFARLARFYGGASNKHEIMVLQKPDQRNSEATIMALHADIENNNPLILLDINLKKG
jgi:hypothetical protein